MQGFRRCTTLTTVAFGTGACINTGARYVRPTKGSRAGESRKPFGYDAKPDGHSFRMEQQRMNSFRWHDTNRMRTHRKYDVDPTAWNREDRAVKASASIANTLATQTNVEVRVPYPPQVSEGADFEPLQNKQLDAVCRLVQSPRLAEPWLQVRRIVRALRSPHGLSGITRTKCERLLPTAVLEFFNALPRRAPPQSALLEASEAEMGVIAHLVNDIRLVLNASQLSDASLRDRVRPLVVALADGVIDRVSGSVKDEVEPSTTCERLNWLGLVVLSHRRNDCIEAAAVLAQRVRLIDVSGTALENIAACSVLDVTPGQVSWIAALIDTSVRRWLDEARHRDATFAWGNITPGVTTPVPPLILPSLCRALRHLLVAGVESPLLGRSVAALVQLANITPNHILPAKPVLATLQAAHSRGTLNSVDAVIVSQVVFLFSRFTRKAPALSAEEAVHAIEVLLAVATRPDVAVFGSEVRAQAGSALRVLLNSYVSVLGTGSHHATTAANLAQLLVAGNQRVSRDVWAALVKAILQRGEWEAADKTAFALWVLFGTLRDDATAACATDVNLLLGATGALLGKVEREAIRARLAFFARTEDAAMAKWQCIEAAFDRVVGWQGSAASHEG
jgi:hypothetical protein